MVAGSISDSQLFHGSPVSRDFVKKRKANWLWKLKQWNIDALRRQWIYQWKRANAGEVDENGCARLRSLPDKPPDIKAASDSFSNLQAWSIDHQDELGRYEFAKCDDDSDDDDTHLSASSPTSVLKNKDSDGNKSGDDCFCCSRPITEEEDDAFEDALNSFDKEEDNENPLQRQQDPIPNTSASQSNESSPPESLIHNDKGKQEGSAEEAIHHEVSTDKNTESDQKKEGDDEISECPICFENMDETDLSFPTCPCGFQLCLFCHKKIYEGERRCPICKKLYEEKSSNSGEVSVQLRGGGTVRLSSSFEGLT